jgi:UDP-N-acetylmuramate dehydrogenase
MDTIEQQLRARFGQRFKISEPLKSYTTMKVGGVADYFLVARTVNELVAAVTAAWELDIPYFILAGGSNILVSDYGFPGLVVKNETSELIFLKEKSQVIADSGTSLGYFISQCASQGLSGFEWAAGIPGTIGGALYGNMAAWGNETIQFIKSATLLVPPEDKDEKPQTVTAGPDWFAASYRTTKLKEMAERGAKRIPVILTVCFQLARRRQDEIVALLRHYQGERQKRQPLGAMTMGSTFRNPGGFPTPDKMKENKQAAGFFLDQAGLKGKKIGGVSVSTKHANFLVNDGSACARDVRKLIELMQDTVREKYKVELHEEIEYIGRW